MGQVRLRGTRLIACLLAGAVVGLAGTAGAENDKPLVVTRAADKGTPLKLQISGQINPMLAIIDNGDNSGAVIGDNTSQPSRISLAMGTTGKYGAINAWGANAELGINPNTLGSYDLNEFSSSSDGGVNTRVAETWFQTDYGKATLGTGASAARYFLDADVSRTDLVQGMDAARNFEMIPFGGSSINVGELFPYSGGERLSRVRYDSPSFGGVSGSASYATEDALEVMAAWAYGFDDVEDYYDYMDAYESWVDKMLVRVGYLNNVEQPSAFTSSGDVRDDYRFGGSASVLLNNGWNATVAYVNREPNDPAPGAGDSQAYLKVGYVTGPWAVSADYGTSNDNANGTRYGLGYTWAIDPYTAGAFVERYDADVSGASTDAVWTVGTTFALGF